MNERDSLAADVVDLVFLQTKPDCADVDAVASASVHRMAVFSSEHELANRGGISMRDLNGDSIIVAAPDLTFSIPVRLNRTSM